MPEQRERWLTLRQVRAMLRDAGIEKSDQTIRNWADANTIKTRRSPGRQRHYAESSVRAFIATYWQDEHPAAPAEAPASE